MNSEANLKGESFGVYVADPIVVRAWREAGRKSSPSKYGLAAIVEKLQSDGLLPQTENEGHLLELVREASDAGIDVNALILGALRGEKK